MKRTIFAALILAAGHAPLPFALARPDERRSVQPAESAAVEPARHWAYKPVTSGAPPAVQDTTWSKTSVDPFILAKQEAVGLRPAPAADKLKLIRRATFDLTGLPPTPEEIAAFVQDTSDRAFEAVVDRLLESP